MVSITIEIPDELAKQLEAAGLLSEDELIAAAVQRLQSQPIQPAKSYTIEEMMAALDETYGMFADADWTMDDILAMKREEWEIEERKLNRW